jgi:predicted AAA+ superfamily ATPase
MSISSNLEQQIIRSLRSLPVQKQEAVLEFALSLHASNHNAPLVTQSLYDISKLSLTERKKVIEPYLSAMAEDFATDPVMTEFSVLDSEDWDG